MQKVATWGSCKALVRGTARVHWKRAAVRYRDAAGWVFGVRCAVVLGPVVSSVYPTLLASQGTQLHDAVHKAPGTSSNANANLDANKLYIQLQDGTGSRPPTKATDSCILM